MQRLVTLAVVAALISPTVAFGQYSFGDWARDQGYEPGDVMPQEVFAGSSSIEDLDGMGAFDWTTTPTMLLHLDNNLISSIESSTFDGLTNLDRLYLNKNQLSSIEPGDFGGLDELERLTLSDNQILSIEPGDFSGLSVLNWLGLHRNQISSIEPGGFSGLDNLRTLTLGQNQISSIEPGDFSQLSHLTWLQLQSNQLTSIESGDLSELSDLANLTLAGNQISSIDSTTFSGLTNLMRLDLRDIQISHIESGAFSGLANLTRLMLNDNTVLTELNLTDADFSSLTRFDVEGNVSITRVSLRNTIVSQDSLGVLLDGGVGSDIGIGELDGITEMDLSGIDFADITDLSVFCSCPIDCEPGYGMNDLTDLWLVNMQNVDAVALDELLDNLETIESPDTEGVLYMTEADYNAFNAAGGGLLSDWNDEDGHHVEFLQIGDVNHDTEVNGVDVDPFVAVLLSSQFDAAADMNGDGAVNGLDIDPFVDAVIDAGGAHVAAAGASVPESSTLALAALSSLGLLGYRWRKRKDAHSWRRHLKAVSKRSCDSKTVAGEPP